MLCGCVSLCSLHPIGNQEIYVVASSVCKGFPNVKQINWLDNEEGLPVMTGKKFVTTHRGWIIYMPLCECCL